MRNSKVVVLKTNPQTVVEDYAKLMHLAEYQNILPKNTDIVIKLNLSWTKFYPACSSPPWQLDGVLNTLISDGYNKHMLYPLENRTVVTNPKLGAYNNKWTKVLKKYDINFTSLVDVEWVKYEYDTSELLVLPKLFPSRNISSQDVYWQVYHSPSCHENPWIFNYCRSSEKCIWRSCKRISSVYSQIRS